MDKIIEYPNYLVVELVSLSEFVPWYDLVEFKVVSKDWNAAIDNVIKHNSAWKQILDWINVENRLHECYHCCRPLVRDGSTANICDRTCCWDVQDYFLKMQQAANPIEDPRVREIFRHKSGQEQDIPSEAWPAPFGEMELYDQAFLLFKFHQATVKALVTKYKDKQILSRRQRVSFESHHSLYAPVDQVVTLIVAKERLNNRIYFFGRDSGRSQAVSMALEMACYQVDLLGLHQRICRSFFSLHFDVSTNPTSSYNSPEEKITQLLQENHCDIANHLFGPKLGKSIDILADVREIHDRNAHARQATISTAGEE